MRRHRYMIVEHPKFGGAPRTFQEMILPIHGLLGTHHWVRLDDNHVFLSGHYEASHHNSIHFHPQVSVLPILSSGKKLKAHLSEKVNHWNALSTLGLSEDSTMTDLAEVAEETFGPIFAADK
jgi:hypothetical protein